jgi:DNA-binding transcriptional ArsR family regulator
MPKPALTDLQCAHVLKALGDETRLRLLESLLAQDQCVTELVKLLRRSQPHVSHHLRILRSAGLVEGIREGKRVCYRVAPSVARAIKDRRVSSLDFGCCQLSFPRTQLLSIAR